MKENYERVGVGWRDRLRKIVVLEVKGRVSRESTGDNVRCRLEVIL